MRIEIASTRRARMRGLRGRQALAPDEALLIPNCRSVHTFGMRFPITVVFLDRGFRAVQVIVMRPNRVARPRFRARHMFECSVDAEIRIGESIRLPSGR